MGGVADFVGLEAPDVGGSGVILGAPLVRESRSAAAHGGGCGSAWPGISGRRRSGCDAPPCASAGRPARAFERDPEAVVSTGGRVEHARGAARQRRRAKRCARPRSAGTRARPAALGRSGSRARALARAGRGALVAGPIASTPTAALPGRDSATTARVPHPSALTERERQVVALAAIGRANKCIAYEARPLARRGGRVPGRAMRKLGVASRVELVRLYSALEPRRASGDRLMRRASPPRRSARFRFAGRDFVVVSLSASEPNLMASRRPPSATSPAASWPARPTRRSPAARHLAAHRRQPGRVLYRRLGVGHAPSSPAACSRPPPLPPRAGGGSRGDDALGCAAAHRVAHRRPRRARPARSAWSRAWERGWSDSGVRIAAHGSVRADAASADHGAQLLLAARA